MKNNIHNDIVKEKILALVKTKSPETVQQLLEQVEQELKIPRDVAIKQVIELENLGKIRMLNRTGIVPKNLDAYLFSKHALWFWEIMLISIATAISVFTINQDVHPFKYFRYILGSIFVLFIPGYCLIKTLFPTREIDSIERLILSMGLSITIVPVVGLFLNFTPWGIRLTPVTLSLLILTVILTIMGLLREHNEKIKHLE